MKNRFNIKILIVVIILLIGFISWYLLKEYRSNEVKVFFPLSPTQKEIAEAKKLPREECPCWDNIKEICLPQQACM